MSPANVLWGEPYTESDIGGFNTCRAACMDDPDCLSFGYDTDFANPCHFYNEASITLVKEESSGVYLLGGPTDVAPGTVDQWESYTSVDIDGSSAVPASGTITSFQWYGSNTNGVDFHVFRLVSDKTYEVIGTVSAGSTTVGAENTINVSPAINVVKGDVMGFTWQGAAAFGFNGGSRFGASLYTDEDSGGPETRSYHFAATFVPDQAFTPSDSRHYCAAGNCAGHCGPVMGGSTTTFSWGSTNDTIH
eukprot:CAMPEP_0178943538 /NCGR_PEP_ID=MMETSP0789-20121207/2643_1 /TAXON_ID=3005 /ORGANISM="Rhizosolenia setigera, Strain CCMP 1694" /LENGTH=247 /DNA_ID=CAMNT_0020623145 /DNA_START=333 /DNA_END=1077 /DNA_ORIENTATION=+